MMRNDEEMMECFRLEERVLFEAAGATEIADAQADDPNADMNPTEQQARNEKAASQDAPPETPSGAMTAPDGVAQPDKVADIDAEIQALIEGEIGAPDAGMDVIDDMINDLFNDYGADAVEDVIQDAFAQDNSGVDTVPDITIEPELELVIINGSVQDSGKIIDSLKPNQEYLILDADQDAMAQIDRYLDASGKSYSAIHIVTHGNAGYFILGDESVSAAEFDAKVWNEIGSHLTKDGDILIYGCNLAESESGQSLIDMIADASGADVAASTNTTGIGGDWELEYQHGAIEALSITVDGYDYRLNDWQVTLSTDDFSTTGGEQDASLAFDLRYAVTNAISGDSISFKLDGTDTITLNGKLVISQSKLTINGSNLGSGAGDGVVTVQTNGGDFHLFEANDASTDWNLTFKNINLIGNQVASTTAEGGAIFVSGRDVILNLDHVNISDSIARNGGAVYAKATGSLNLTATASTFSRNTTTSWGSGGAIYASATTLDMTLTDSHFESNSAYSYGGAVAGWLVTGATGTINVDNTTFSGNSVSNSDGGAMYFGGGSGSLLASIKVTVNDSLFENNSGSHLSGGSPGGGAIAFRSCGSVDLTITDSQFLSNDGYEGGALLIIAGNYAKLTIDGSEFTGNSTIKQDGGAISVQIGSSSTAATYGVEISISDSLFEDNDAIRGGAISVNDLSKSIKMEVADTMFKGNSAWQNGGGIFLRAEKGSIVLDVNDGTVFDGNKAATSVVAQSANAGYGGGAIAAWGLGGVTINVNGTYDQATDTYSVQFINNTVESASDNVLLYGGAIAIAAPTAYLSPAAGSTLTGNVNITGAYFANNTVKATGSGAQGQGGAVYVNPYTNYYSYNISSESNVNINGTALFRNNEATTAGGAIYATSVRYGSASTQTARTNLNISGNAQFDGNKSGLGGAIYLNSESKGSNNYTAVNGTISGATFTGNSAAQDGGAVYVAARPGTSSSLIMINSDTTFCGNSSNQNGGAIYLGNNVALTIAGATFLNNTAVADGGSIFLGGTTGAVNVSDAHFEFTDSTNAATRGGTIYTNRSVTLTNSEFSGFQANQGGAIYNAAGTLKITDTSFYKNAAVDGGAIYNGATCVVVNSSFYGNRASGNGGAIFNNRALTVVDSSFAANGAAAGGGALFQNLSTASMQILNSVLVGNYSTSTAVADDINYALGTLKMVYSVYGAINKTTGLDTSNKTSDIDDVYNAHWDGLELKNNDTNAVILENNIVVISRFGMAAYSGTLVGERSGVYYYRDMAANLWRNLSDSTTYTFDANDLTSFGLTGGTVIKLGQNLGDRTATHLAYNAGAYVLEIARELPSVIVTTDKDVINPFDYLISLREAIEVYGGRTFSGTYMKDGAGVTLTNETIGQDITFAIENFAGTDLVLTVYSQLTVNATYLSNMTINGYNNATLLGNVTIKVENAGRILSGGSWISNPSASTYRIFTLSGNNANWDLEFSNLNLIGGLLNKYSTGGAIYVYGATAKLLLDNVNISGSQAGRGGALAVDATGDRITLNINDSTFTGNMAADNISSGDSGGAISAQTSRTTAPTAIDITITGASEFRNNSSAGWGGAIGAVSTYDLTITITGDAARHVIFDGNQALYGSGGAILAQGSRGITTLNFDYVTMNANTAVFGGGAVFIPGGTNFVWNTERGATIDVTNSIFSDNKVILENSAAVTGGGAFGILHERLTTFNISDSTFSGNSSTRQGGAILILDCNSSGAPRIDTIMTLSNTDFLNNTAGGWAGAIYMYGNITVDGGSFAGNSAGYCGAIMLGKYAAGNAVLTATGTLFEGNHSTAFAGAISATSMILEDVTFKDNYVNAKDIYAYAGAISGGSMTLKGNILFEGNYVRNTGEAYGGAFYGYTLTVADGANVSFINNSAISTGGGNAIGGAILSHRDLSLTGVLFQGNSAGYGGAIYSACNVILNNCTFINNSATVVGGAIYLEVPDAASIPTLTVLNSTLTGNSAGYGGAIYNGSTTTVSNSTFSKNSATESGGALYNDTDSTATVSNSTFYSNSATVSGGAFYSEGTLTLADVTLVANHAASGGAIDLNGGNAYVINTLMLANYQGDDVNSLSDIKIEDGLLSMAYSIYGEVDGAFTDRANTKLSDTGIADPLKNILGAMWNAAKTDLVMISDDSHVVLDAEGVIAILNTGLAAYSGSLVGKIGGHFYYRDMADNTWKSFTTLQTFAFNTTGPDFGLTGGTIIDVGQNAASRVHTHEAYNVGAYAIDLVKELPSTVVTTDQDIVNPFDYVISLREAVEVYGGRAFTGTYYDVANDAIVTVNGYNPGTGITFAIENFSGTDLVVTVYSQLTIDAAYLSTMTINGYNNATLQGRVTITVATPSSSAYRLFTADSSTANWNLGFSNLNMVGGVLSNTASGGAIYVNGVNATVSLTGVNISGSQAVRGGAVAVIASGDALTLTVKDCTFTGNMTFDKIGSGDSGGAIFAQTTRTTAETTLNITISGKTSFLNNSSSGWGGAIGAISSYHLNLTIAGTDAGNRVIFDGNKALYGSGGAIFIQGSRGLTKVDINYTTMNANTAVFGGGAIYLSSGSNYSTYPGRESRIDIKNSNFTGNKVTLEGSAAVTGGGAINVEHEWLSTFNIADSTFSGNISPRSGGAIMISNSSSAPSGTEMTLTNTHFLNNICTTWGGAIYVKGNITITGGSFVGNKSDFGGAILLGANNSTEGIFTATGTLFEGNGATSLAGAVSASSLILEDVTFRNNYVNANTTSIAYGGAIAGKTTLKGTVLFEGNSVTNKGDAYGGAIYGSSLTIADDAKVSFIGNSVTSSGDLALGGAIHISNNLSLTGIIFEDNSAQYGGAIYSNRNITLDGCTFKENEATINGGAIYLVPNSTAPVLIIRNGTVFEGNTAVRYGGAIYANATTFTISGSYFNGNSAGRYGGAIYANCSVTINDGTQFGNISGNTAGEYGGAILAYGTLTVSNAEFYRNSAKLSGGAISGMGSVILNNAIFGDSAVTGSGNTAGEGGGAVCAFNSLQVTDSSFALNSAEMGGAIYSSSDFTVTGSTFVSNVASLDGGAIYGDGDVFLQDVVFGDENFSGRGNHAGQDGGAVYAYSALQANDVYFYYNTAGRDGGALYTITDGGVNSSFYIGNTAGRDGGAIYSTGILALNNSVFRTNSADRNGGAIYSDGELTLNNASFTGNTTKVNGGALYLADGGTFDSAGAIGFYNNHADVDGGAIYSLTGFSISAIFHDNTANRNGGAIYAADNLTVTHSEFRWNAAEGDGGAVYAIGQSLTMDNTLVADSTAKGNGGGIYATAAVSLLNLTVANNTAKGNGGGMWNTAPATVRNSIFWGNRGAAMNQLNTGVTNAVTYSGIEGWTLGGTGNVNLQSANARTDSSKNENAKNEYYVCFFDEENGDYTLDKGSYLINRGSNSYVTMPETDLADDPRIFRYGNGGIVDMGAYESQHKGNVVIDASADDLVYGETETLSAGQDGYGGGDFTFTSTNTDYVKINGDKATAWKANEEVDVTVDYSGDDNWNEHSATIKVNTQQRDITLKASDARYTYDGTTHKFYWDGNAGGLGFAFDDVLISYDSKSYRNAGEYFDALFNALISSSTRGDMTGNYNINYEKGTMIIDKATLTVTRDGENKVYDGTTNADYTWSFNGLVAGDDVDYTKGNAQFGDKNVGKNKTVYFNGDSLSGDDLGNYTIHYNDLGADITKATLVVNRDGENKVYDGTTAAQYTWSFDGLFGNDDVTYNKGTASFGDKNAGKNKTVYFNGDSLSGSDLDNYEITYDDKGADITKATIVVNRDGESKVYDGTTHADYTWSIDGVIAGDDVDYNKGAANFSDKNAGTNKTIYFNGDSLSGSDADNYEVIYDDLGADIFKATIVVNRDGEDKTYDGTTNADYTWSLDGLIDGDDVTYNKGNARFSDKNAGMDKDVYFDGDSLSGVDAGNYEITYDDKGADIFKATIVVNRDGEDKTYDGTTNADYTWSLDGVVAGDDVNYNKGDASFADKNAGKNKTVYFDGDSLSGSDLDNYEISYNDLGADIFKATIVVNRDGEDKTYDGTTYADYTWSLDGVVAGDDVNYNKGDANFSDKNAGTNKIVYFNGDSLSGSDLDNYEISYNDLGADIFKATIVINRDGEDKTYDGTTNADYTWSLDGVVAGDDVNYNKGDAAFADKNAGKDKTVYFDGDSLSGSDLDNYEITYDDKGADIAKAGLVITIDDKSKLAGESDPAFTGHTEGLADGDSVFGYDRSNKGEAAGKYAIDEYQIDDGNDGNNYDITVIDGTLTIIAPAPAPTPVTGTALINIYMDASSRNYDVNGMEEANLINMVSALDANREMDTEVDEDSNANVNSSSFQTIEKGTEKAKTQFKEISQKKAFEESDLYVVQQKANSILANSGIQDSRLKADGKSSEPIQIMVPESKSSGNFRIVPPVGTGGLNLDFTNESTHPMNTMPSPIDISGGGVNVINFNGLELTDAAWTEKAENLKDRLDLLLEEMMAV